MAHTELRRDIGIPLWLESDTEESVVGTEWHQEAIGGLATMLRIIADRRGVSWGICEQIQLLGLYKPNGDPYNPRPDVMVLAQPFDGRRSSIPLAEAGVPLFIMEVASESTVEQDVEGKKDLYARIGVPEYIIFDPDGAWLGTAAHAWSLPSPTSAIYTAWALQSDGWWHSSALDVSFQTAPPFLRVRDRDGRVIDQAVVAARRAEQLERQLREVERRLHDLEEQLGQRSHGA